ncbi:hypothetical protein ACE2AJ_03555 [Aquihabitans daechungensis]|uniref:hypothetical protein n=1 Tax=Aquihabitans daechungensis TaxID=1052257 RepID=UPI003BA2EAEA
MVARQNGVVAPSAPTQLPPMVNSAGFGWSNESMRNASVVSSSTPAIVSSTISFTSAPLSSVVPKTGSLTALNVAPWTAATARLRIGPTLVASGRATPFGDEALPMKRCPILIGRLTPAAWTGDCSPITTSENASPAATATRPIDLVVRLRAIVVSPCAEPPAPTLRR